MGIVETDEIKVQTLSLAIVIIILVSILLFIAYAGLMLFYRQNWLACQDYMPSTTQEAQEVFITVIIPARNEEKYIAGCLNSIITQDYPGHLYEIIVADDFSSDSTAQIVDGYGVDKVSRLALQDHLEEGTVNSYKKKAIELAITRAKGELIVTTDADCIVPPGWLKTIGAFYSEKAPAFITAPVMFFAKDNFLSIFQSLDFMTLQGITAASARNNFHSMCNGANLAYQKKVFHEVGGFMGIDDIASGDDMLLMHKIAMVHPQKMGYLKSKDAIVKTAPMATVAGFLQQRIRWASKSGSYSDKKIIAVLAMVYVFNAWLLLLLILSFFSSAVTFLFLALLAGKICIELLFLYPVALFFNQTLLLWWFPLCQPFHILYIITAGWLGKFGKYRWKGRKVK